MNNIYIKFFHLNFKIYFNYYFKIYFIIKIFIKNLNLFNKNKN